MLKRSWTTSSLSSLAKSAPTSSRPRLIPSYATERDRNDPSDDDNPDERGCVGGGGDSHHDGVAKTVSSCPTPNNYTYPRPARASSSAIGIESKGFNAKKYLAEFGGYGRQYPQGILYPTLPGDRERDWSESTRCASLGVSPSQLSGSPSSPNQAYTPDIELLPCVCFPGQLCYDSCALRSEEREQGKLRGSSSCGTTKCCSNMSPITITDAQGQSTVRIEMGPSGPMFVRMEPVQEVQKGKGEERGGQLPLRSRSSSIASPSPRTKVRSLTEAVMELSLGPESEEDSDG